MVFSKTKLFVLSFVFLTAGYIGCDFLFKNKIATQAKVNSLVSAKFINDAQVSASKKLCIDTPFSIEIIDVGGQAAFDEHKVVTAHDISIVWPFETDSKRLSDNSFGLFDHLEYFTRPDSINHVVKHELGHLIFLKYVMDNQIVEGKYGSSAPDWLDEIAAISFESDHQRLRRKNKLLRSFEDDRIYSLESYLNIDRQKTDFVGVRDTSSTQLSTGSLMVPRRFAEEPNSSVQTNMSHPFTFLHADGTRYQDPLASFDKSIYYAQSSTFLEFLDSVMEDKCYIKSIGKFISSGGTFEEWLLNNDVGGVDTIEELEIRYVNWLFSQMQNRKGNLK